MVRLDRLLEDPRQRRSDGVGHLAGLERGEKFGQVGLGEGHRQFSFVIPAGIRRRSRRWPTSVMDPHRLHHPPGRPRQRITARVRAASPAPERSPSPVPRAATTPGDRRAGVARLDRRGDPQPGVREALVRRPHRSRHRAPRSRTVAVRAVAASFARSCGSDATRHSTDASTPRRARRALHDVGARSRLRRGVDGASAALAVPGLVDGLQSGRDPGVLVVHLVDRTDLSRPREPRSQDRPEILIFRPMVVEQLPAEELPATDDGGRRRLAP